MAHVDLVSEILPVCFAAHLLVCTIHASSSLPKPVAACKLYFSLRSVLSVHGVLHHGHVLSGAPFVLTLLTCSNIYT